MNTKLKCLLLDDELPSLSYLKLLCQQIQELEIVRSFDSSSVLLSQLDSLAFDLIIMDIEMPEISGLELANKLHHKSVIFTTAYSEYAADAFDLQAVDYLRKPLTLERLKQAVSKVHYHISHPISRENVVVQLNSDRGKYMLYFDHLAFVSTSTIDSRDKLAFMFDGTWVTLKNISFDNLQDLLPSTNFCRVNKKELINISIVKSFSHDIIQSNFTLSDKTEKHFSLGEAYKHRLIELISI